MTKNKVRDGIIFGIVLLFVGASILPSISGFKHSQNIMENQTNQIFKSNRDWTIIETFAIPEDASGLAWDGTYLYCGIYGANGDRVYQIDPTTGAHTLLFTGPQEDAFGLTFDGTYLWTTDHPGSSSDPAIAMQLDLSGSLISQFDLPDHYMSGIAYDAGDFWAATYYSDPGTIYKLNETGFVLDSFTPPEDQPWDLCIENDHLWMADKWADTLYMIDPTTGGLIESHASEGTDPAGVVWDGSYLWYCDNGEGGVDYLYKVDLGGEGTPAINVPTDTYDYGPITSGDSDIWYCYVENIGSANLSISDVTFSGSSDLTCAVSFPIEIEVGNYTLIPFTFSPSGYGELDAIGTIHSNDPIHPAEEVILIGWGVNSGPDIYVTETSHNYGTVRNGAYTRWMMTIENHGDTTLIIDDVKSDDMHFIVDDQINYPFIVDVLSSVNVGIWFSPEEAILYTTEVSMSNNDPDDPMHVVDVQGTGLEQDWPMGDTLWQDLITTGYDNSVKAITAIEDVNGDGKSDVIICSEDDYIRCFNGNAHGQGDILWEHEIYSGSIYNQQGLVINEDVNSDGYQDVVVGSSWGGRLIRTISGRTGEEIWTHDTHEYGDGGWVYQVDCSFDYNGDGVKDVLATTGDDAGDIGPKRTYCLDGITGVSIWECPLGGAGFSVIGVEDFTGDGHADVITGASNEDETQGFVYGINGSDGDIEWSYPVTGTSVWALGQLDDINSDGVKDVVAGDFSMGGGSVYWFDATDGDLLYIYAGLGPIVRIETIDDVNDDGLRDIVPAYSGSNAMVLDGSKNAIVWMQPIYDKPWVVTRCDDISGDGINDVMIGTLFTDNYVYFIDGTNGSTLGLLNFGTPVDAIGAIPDVVGDGSWEMIAGGRDGSIFCYSGGLDALTAICGDANGDETVNVGDAVYLINYVFKGGPAPDPVCSGDANGDGDVNVGDAVYLINYVFKGGPAPVEDCCV